MTQSQSEPRLLCKTQRQSVGNHIGNAVPGYAGHVPGHRIEVTNFGQTFARDVEASRSSRTRHTVDPQALRLTQERAEMRRTCSVPTVRGPTHDPRGFTYPAAGDTRHSRVPPSGEEKAHYHSSMGLTSLAHEGLGGAGHLKGYAKAATGIPGYRGYVPGKAAENVFAEGWSKSHEQSLGAHFSARASQAKKFSIIAEGGTMVPAHPSDSLKEIPIKSNSYHDRVRGWSNCEFVGTQVDPAGRMAPSGRQEGFGAVQANINTMTASAPIHGYAGWVPGRVGENVVGERQCKTNAVSQQLFNKSRMRITQR